jgi:hypothetical protein
MGKLDPSAFPRQVANWRMQPPPGANRGTSSTNHNLMFLKGLPYNELRFRLEFKKAAMSCRSCGSKSQTKFAAEMSVHVLGLENVDKPAVSLFPRLLVCMNCGFTELTLAEEELRLLGKGPAEDFEAAG